MGEIQHSKSKGAKLPAKKKTTVAEETVMLAIKGFNSDMTCRGFQFEVGKTYTHTGKVVACGSGFHAIMADAHPLAVFQYYPPAGSKFHRVELSGSMHTDDNEKIAAEILKVGDEIGLNDLIQEAVKWVTTRATPEGERATGDQGAASATGYQGAASATGYQGAASATGTRGAASATGDQGAAVASGLEGRVKGSAGNALFACERQNYHPYDIISVACGIAGRDGIDADTWYACKGGKLVPA